LGSIDSVIAAFARRQHGVVTTAQLAGAGVSRNAIRLRERRGLLTRLHQGVYRLGPTHSPFADSMAATLACAGVLSHQSAAALLGIRRPERGPVHVTVTRGHARKRKGLVIHRTRHLRPDEVTTWKGITTTTAARTLLDLATELPTKHLTRAIEEAQIQRHLDHSSLADAVDNARGHRGRSALRAATTTNPKLTRSEAERRLLELIRAAELPEPETNRRVGGYEVDVLWPVDRLVVEVDGFAFHGGREAFERDRRRDAELTAAGFRVARVTWRQIADEPEALVARLARSLSAGRAPGRPPSAAAPPGFPPCPPRP
jgi:very-short-patch-repair endonuclease